MKVIHKKNCDSQPADKFQQIMERADPVGIPEGTEEMV